jgi:amino acid transporter
VFVAQLLCGLATVTSVSRMLFAFSRDDGVPGISKALAKVDPKLRSPVNAIWAGSALAVLFVWFTSAITIAGTPAYSIVVSCTVIFLFLSFTVPIALALFTYGTAKFPAPGPWNLGGPLFRLVCVLSIIAMGVIIFAGIQPPNDWALPISVGFIVLSLVLWLLFENRRFKGPPIGDEIKRRQAEIKAAEAALGGAG